MLTNLLIYRFVLVNALFFALTASLWWNGYLTPIFATDLSRLTVAIAGLFALGWLGMAREIVIASRQLNYAKSALQPAREAERDKDLAKVEWLGSVSEWLVGLGLIGTVVGFIMALSSVDQSVLVQSSGAQSAVATLMAGMRIALTRGGKALRLAQMAANEERTIWLACEMNGYWKNPVADKFAKIVGHS